MMPETGVTLGEVSRNLVRLESTVRDMTQTVLDLRTDMVREIDSQLEAKLESTKSRIDRLEKIIYGAVATVLVSFLLALLNLVISK